jgi:hypothetical protein
MTAGRKHPITTGSTAALNTAMPTASATIQEFSNPIEFENAKKVAIDLLYRYLLDREKFWASLTQQALATWRDVPQRRRDACDQLVTRIQEAKDFEGVIRIIKDIIKLADGARKDASDASFLFDSLHGIRNIFVSTLKKLSPTSYHSFTEKTLAEYNELDNRLVTIRANENDGSAIANQRDECLWLLIYLEDDVGLSKGLDHKLYLEAKLAMPLNSDIVEGANKSRPICLQKDFIERVFKDHFSSIVNTNYQDYLLNTPKLSKQDKDASLIKILREMQGLSLVDRAKTAASHLTSTLSSAAMNFVSGWGTQASTVPVPDPDADDSDTLSETAEEGSPSLDN